MRRSLAILSLALLTAACGTPILSPTIESVTTTTPVPSQSPAPSPTATPPSAASVPSAVDAEEQEPTVPPITPAPSPTPDRVDTWTSEAPNGSWIAQATVEYPSSDSDQCTTGSW